MKKRLIACTLSAILALTLLAGCSYGKDNDGSSASASGSENAGGTTVPDTEEEKELIKITLNEVAHSIFYAPMYVAIEEDYFTDEGIELDLVCGFGDNILGRDVLKKPRICVA